MIGTSEVMKQLRARIHAAARASGSILVVGETGSGKELVARAIHVASGVPGKFVAVDCGALPDELIESELFGHRRGAFTTAVSDKPGLIEEANRGTLFLDEIGNTVPRFQAKLLRVLQDREVRRLGDVIARRVDIRVIAATNANLGSMVKTGAFREDLFYRLNVFPIHVPPLRRRKEDITALTGHLLNQLAARSHEVRTLRPDALRKLEGYSFPGNVRELENIIATAYYTASGEWIEAEDIALPYDVPAIPPEDSELAIADFWESIAKPFTERQITRAQLESLIRKGLEHAHGNYRRVVTFFNMPPSDYKRFMDFLRRHHCNVDFRPYRRGTAKD